MNTNQSRRTLLVGAPVAAAAVLTGSAVAIGMAKADEVDPIFAAIEAHRAAVQAVNAAHDISCNMLVDDPAFEAANEASSSANDDETDALRDVLSCRPKTIGGVLALLDHLGQPQFLRHTRDPATVLSGAHGWHDDEQDEVKAFPHLLAAALRDIIERQA